MLTKILKNVGRVTHGISRDNLDLVGMPKNYIFEENEVSLYKVI